MISRHRSQTNARSEFGIIGLEHRGQVMPGQTSKARLQFLTSRIFEEERPMKRLIAVAAFSLMCGSAFAQNNGPAPQTGMEKPGMTNGAKEDGSMDTTGMS